MQVTLNIHNDQELRLYIKDLIRGQVLSIVREEYMEIVKEEISRKVKGSDISRNQFHITEAIKAATFESIFSPYNSNKRGYTELFADIVKDEIAQAVATTNWKNLVNDLAKEKIKELIK